MEQDPVPRLEDEQPAFGAVAEEYRDEYIQWTLPNLGLNIKSTIGEVRAVANSMRERLKSGQVNTEELRALLYVLRDTGDCVNDHEFVSFILDRFPLSEIRLLLRKK